MPRQILITCQSLFKLAFLDTHGFDFKTCFSFSYFFKIGKIQFLEGNETFDGMTFSRMTFKKKLNNLKSFNDI